MKYRIDTVMKTRTGEEMKGPPPDAKPATVRMALEQALLTTSDVLGGPPPSPEIRRKRFNLWKRMRDTAQGGELELSGEELATLQAALVVFPTYEYGLLMDIFDQKDS